MLTDNDLEAYYAQMAAAGPSNSASASNAASPQGAAVATPDVTGDDSEDDDMFEAVAAQSTPATSLDDLGNAINDNGKRSRDASTERSGNADKRHSPADVKPAAPSASPANKRIRLGTPVDKPATASKAPVVIDDSDSDEEFEAVA